MLDREPFKAIASASETIDFPILTPHLEYRAISSDRVLLVSEEFNTLLHGQIYKDLLGLLDGSASQEEIVSRLSLVHSAASVRSALQTLAAKGYVVPGNFKMSRRRAAFWSSLGASPHQAEEKLSAATVTIDGDDNLSVPLAACLESFGVGIGSDCPSLHMFISEDYLSERFEAVNQHHVESGAPWILIQPWGMHPLFGPVFKPAQRGPCWSCLAHRMRNHREVHAYLRNKQGEAAAFRATASEPAALDIVIGIIAAEISKWLVLGNAAALDMHAITLDLDQMKTDRHPVVRRPQCMICGDEQLRRTDRPAVRMQLQSSPKFVRTSGGMRSVSPAQTLEQYQHLISPVSGIVTWLERTAPKTDPWLHVHSAGSNLALRIKSLRALRHSLRSNSAGKGSSDTQSEASALCEAIERYSGAFHGDEIRCNRRFLDFQDGQAIHPNDIQLFSDSQLDRADEINARGHPYNIVPLRFDPARPMDWSPVWSLTQGRHRYLPTSVVYGMTPEESGYSGLFADSNGCAAGNSLEEAVLQGFFELVERDAFAIWWYNRLSLPGVDLDSLDDEYLAGAGNYYRDCHRDIWVLDITSDLGIPAFVALSRRTDCDAQDIIYGAGAHIDPRIAILRAVCELNQCLTWVPKPGQNPGYTIDNPMCLHWWQNGKLQDNPHLAPAGEVPLRVISDYAILDTEDTRDDIEMCRKIVENKGMEFLVLDQTRLDVNMPVVRVIVPGMRHFWDRFAPGRLYDVPVEMGKRKSVILEKDLNPVPVLE